LNPKRISRAKRLLRYLLLCVSTVLLCTNLSGQSSSIPKEKKIALKGRVLADVASLTFGAGVGPQYQRFIFGVESKNAHGEQVVTPVEILYAFFKDQGPLRDDFFNHSTVYELNVVRDSNCDQSVSALSYEKAEDTTGKELPPLKVLQVLYGAPRDVLKPDAVLPCYILHGREYKVASQDADRITRCLVRVPQELQDSAFTVIYKFETKDGKPVNIIRVKNDVLKDDEFAACISRWTVPSLKVGYARFTWNPTDGWTLSVSVKNETNSVVGWK
jgi:hypothetical protein